MLEHWISSTFAEGIVILVAAVTVMLFLPRGSNPLLKWLFSWLTIIALLIAVGAYVYVRSETVRYIIHLFFR